MAEYCPPLENVPIFNDAYFQCDNVSSGSGIGYLQYPTAQGDETLQGITVNGLSNFNQKATFQGLETNSTTDIKGVSNFTNIMNITNTSSFPMNILNFPYIGNYMGAPASNQLISKYYADQTYTTSASILSSNNVWTGTNDFTLSLPTSSISATLPYQFTNLSLVQSLISNIYTVPHTWSATQTFTQNVVSTNWSISTVGRMNLQAITFNGSAGITVVNNTGVNFDFKQNAPIMYGTNISNINATNISTGTLNDARLSTNVGLLNANQTWTAGNDFSGNVNFTTANAQSTITPTTLYEYTNKSYVDTRVNSLLSASNTWTSINTYNNYLPRSLLTPTLAAELTTKAYVDSVAINPSTLLSSNNSWTGTNSYSQIPTCSASYSGVSPIGLITKDYADSTYSPTTLLGLNNSWTGTNTFSNNFSLTSGTTSINPSYLYFNTAPTAKYDGGVIGYGEPSIKISDSIYGNTSATTGAGNILIGKNIMNTSNSSAYYNTIIGLNNLTNLVSGGENIAIGYSNNPNPTSTNTCVGIGSYNLYNNISGFSNIAIGNANVATITSGIYNVGIGRSSCSSNGYSDSNRCIGIGIFATANLGSASGINVQNNTGVGYCALNGSGNNATGYDNIHFLDGSNNTGLGYCAGLTLNGSSSNNTFLGANTDVSNIANTYQQSTAIGYGATITGNNQIILGTSTETTTPMGRLNVGNVSYTKIQLITTNTLSPSSSDTGTYYNLNSATTGTLVIPNANVMIGMDFTFCNVGSGRWNLSPSGGVFNQFNSSNTLIWIWSGDIIRVRSDGTNWYVIGNNWDCIKSSRASSINAVTNLTIGVQSSPSWYPFACSTTALTANTTLTLPLYNSYIITATGTITITLPSASAVLVGCKITFRKVGGTIGIAHNIVPASTQNIIPFNSVTTQTTSTPLLSATATAINYVSVSVICYNSTSWMICN